MMVLCIDVETVWGKRISIHLRDGTNDPDVARAVMVADEYCANEFAYDDGDIFIDLGSHIGTWAVLMAMKNPTFEVYAYEPVPENFAILRKNITVNKLYNIKPFNLAVSSESGGTEDIYYTDDSTPFGKAHKYVASMLGGKGTRIRVPRISLNDILDRLPRVRVLKADCEGCMSKAIAYVTPENLEKIDYVVGEFHSMHGMTIKDFYQFFKPFFKDASQVITKKGDIDRFLYINRRCY